jgi:hypothetical protein
MPEMKRLRMMDVNDRRLEALYSAAPTGNGMPYLLLPAGNSSPSLV